MKRRQIGYDPKNDFYTRIGIKPNATHDEIQQAYRQKAKQLHPDLNPERREWATAQFQLLNEAYDVLSDPTLRLRYDEQRYLRNPMASNTASRSKARRASPSDQNWWDVPHTPQPNDADLHRRPVHSASRQRYKLAGEWLERYELGFLRTYYTAILGLVFSPYRYVLGCLTLVLLGNVIFIMVAFSSPDEEAVKQENLIPATSVAQGGVIPTPVPRLPTPTFVADSSLIELHFCSPQASLAIESVEWLIESVKIVAKVRQPARVANTHIMRVEVINNTLVQRLEPAQNLELILLEDAAAAPTAASEVFIVPDMTPGSYLIEWTPISPTGQVSEYCQQLIFLANE